MNTDQGEGRKEEQELTVPEWDISTLLLYCAKLQGKGIYAVKTNFAKYTGKSYSQIVKYCRWSKKKMRIAVSVDFVNKAIKYFKEHGMLVDIYNIIDPDEETKNMYEGVSNIFSFSPEDLGLKPPRFPVDNR